MANKARGAKVSYKCLCEQQSKLVYVGNDLSPPFLFSYKQPRSQFYDILPARQEKVSSRSGSWHHFRH